MSGLFEPLSREEYERMQPAASPKQEKKKQRTRTVVTEPRTNTTWFQKLGPHVMGFCNCPEHDEIQRMLDPQAQAYRQKYPTRMTYEIKPGLFICRDCFVNEGDKDGGTTA